MATFSIKPLQAAIKNLRGIAPYKTECEAQKGIFYKSGMLLASSTDMAILLRSDRSLIGESFIIPNRAFDLLGALDGEEVEITAEGTTLNIKCGKLKNKFTTFDINTYVMPSVEDTGICITVDAEAFCGKAGACLTAVNETESLKTMTGLYLSAADGSIDIVGANSHQITIGQMTAETGTKAEVIVPKKAVLELLKLKLKGRLLICISEKGVQFKGDGVTLFTRCIEGKYFDYHRLSFEGNTSEEVSRDLLTQAVRRAKSCTSMNDKAPIIMSFTQTGLVMDMQTQACDYHDELPDVNFPKEVRIGFSPVFLEQSLNTLAGEKCSIKLADSHSPAVFTEEGMQTYLLPVNIA